MKYLLRIWLAALLIPAMAVSAMATVDIGGSVALDVYYYHQDKEGFARYTSRTTPGSGGIAGLPEGATTNEEDRAQTYFDLNRSSHIRFIWTNDAGVGLYITPYLHADPRQSSSESDNIGFQVGIANAAGWWDITRKLRIIGGKGGYEEIFSPDSPGTTMGYDGIGKVIGLGYGNVDSKYQNGVRFTYKFSSSISAKLGLLESRLRSSSAYVTEILAETGTVADNVTVMPKFELAIPMIFPVGNNLMTITPSGMFIQQKYDNVAPGADDTITSYGMSLGVKAIFSKLSIKAEITHAQNLNNAGRTGVCTSYPFKYEYASTIGAIQYAKTDTAGKIYDSATTAGWVEFRYTIGKFKPGIFYGQQRMTRDMPGADSDATTQFYGLNCDIDLVKNFIFIPEVTIYDNGDGKLSGIDYKFGKELVIGTQLRWIF